MVTTFGAVKSEAQQMMLEFAVTTDSQGNTYVTGFTQGILHGASNAGGLDVFLIKFSGGARTVAQTVWFSWG